MKNILLLEYKKKMKIKPIGEGPELEDCLYKDVLDAAYPIFRTLIDDLVALPEGSGEDAIKNCFKCCILSLNEVNADETMENNIDTEERDAFCAVIDEITRLVGLDPDRHEICDDRDW